MGKPLRVLIVEDVSDDADLLVRTLRREGYEPSFERVDSPESMEAALTRGPWDVVLADYSMPRFNAPAALKLVQQSRMEIPVIIVSGSIGEETAVAAMKAGAYDYLMKNNLAKLGAAVDRGLREAESRSEKRRIEAELKESEERYKGLIDVAFDGSVIHQQGVIRQVNRAFAEMFGYSEDELLGKPVIELLAPESVEHVTTLVKKGVEEPYEAVCLRKDGSRILIEWCAKNCTFRGAAARISVGRDITDRKRAEETILHQAYHDDLTGLPNRVLFKYYLTRELAHAHHTNTSMAILLLELDRFKTINDTLGPAVGDRLLQGVAQRLRKGLEDRFVLARMGGDEFVVLAGGLTGDQDLGNLVQTMMNYFTTPWEVDGHELHVTCSMGTVVYPEDGEDVETMLKNADTAMYSAKDQGRNTVKAYSQSMNVKSTERLALENSLRHVLDRQELLLYYQPQVHIESGQMIGMEALIRWQHPKMGLMSPAEFIPLAEDTGLIVPLGEWILYTACEHNKRWQVAGLPPLRVSVNLSARQFQQENLLEMVAKTLKATGLDPQFLDLEITETLAMQNADFTVRVLQGLKEMGVHISLDDFGTGYSSLTFLRRFPIHCLKIDQSFIRELMTDFNASVIAEAVIALAHSLKLKVTAEGVETPEQLAFLKKHRCDFMQGYLFSKPLPHQAFERVLTAKTGS